MDVTSPGREREVDPAREASVVVVGSLNLDLVVPVPRHPAPGETVLGGDHFANPGGKGANQAAAAARLGQRVALVGRVGDDDAGRRLVASLNEDGVDTRSVFRTDDAPSGIALITVDRAGENAIVVSPGANGRLSAADVASASSLLAGAAVTLLQLEVPLEATIEATRLAAGTVVLNPAPAQALPAELLEAVDVLVPNRAELAALAGSDRPETLQEVAAIARRIDGARTVVVTLGAEGALLVHDEHASHMPAPEIRAVDTTAAGDSFCGALADALERGTSIEAAIAWAVRAAAITTTRPGAQSSLPTRVEVEQLAG
jgi:ribokinase